jgi:hypothetical protein
MDNGEFLKAIEQMMARTDANEERMETKIDANKRPTKNKWNKLYRGS